MKKDVIISTLHTVLLGRHIHVWCGIPISADWTSEILTVSREQFILWSLV